MSNREKIKELFDKGYTQINIARFLKLSRQRVSQIINSYTTAGQKKIKHLVFQRDTFKCQWGKFCQNRDLVIHHIDRDSHNNQMDNLITLCKDCHYEWHRELEKDNLKKYTCFNCKNNFTRYEGKVISRNGIIFRCNECREVIKQEKYKKRQEKKCLTCFKLIPFHQSNFCYTCSSRKRYLDPKEREKAKEKSKRWREKNRERDLERQKQYYRRIKALRLSEKLSPVTPLT